MKPLLIAEVKTKSPFGFKSKLSWDALFEIANEHGDWLSIHTDPRWGGSIAAVRRARAATHKPILAKGMHATDRGIVDAIEAGATYVLTVGRFPVRYARWVLFEPSGLHDLLILRDASRLGLIDEADVCALWNQRDLLTGEPKRKMYSSARVMWPKVWLCQASMIRNPADVHPGANAVLVGEHLPEYCRALTCSSTAQTSPT